MHGIWKRQPLKRTGVNCAQGDAQEQYAMKRENVVAGLNGRQHQF